MPEWCWYNAPEDPWGDKTSKVDPTIIVDYGEDVDSAFIGVRRLVEGSYCYGWMRISTEVDNAPDPNNKSKCYIHDYAFCTDPNYPFRAGQTSFDWVDIKETEAISFVTVQPNPTTGMVTISGEDIQNIEVYDLVGQRVLKQVPGNDNINVDLSGQPAGIYLINVTGKDGRRCVKRIIKQ